MRSTVTFAPRGRRWQAVSIQHWPVYAPIAVSDGRDESILVSITVSVGVAELASARRDLDELLAAADAALYQAKDAGRNRICVITPEVAGAKVPAPRGPGPAATTPK